MGMIARVFDILFGGNRDVLGDTVEIFRENAEAAAGREARARQEALAQFAAEFATERGPGLFDRAVDALNRLPRPLLAFGTLGLFVSAMIDPEWFAGRMAGIALVPEPLWWLLGAVVSFYFGARHQARGQAFQRDVLATLARVERLRAPLAALNAGAGAQAGQAVPDAAPGDVLENSGDGAGEENAALRDWRAGAGGEIR